MHLILRNSKTLLAMIRPPRNPIFTVYDIIDSKHLVELQTEFSNLSEQKFRHEFDCVSPICNCDVGQQISTAIGQSP